MTKEELENNLGIIAKSGSLAFKNENELKDGHDIIGQFGVGFYAAFMVADVVTVISKALGSDEAYKWESKVQMAIQLNHAEKDSVGTEIIFKIKENTEDENYDEFLEEYRLKSIIKKYSDFIRYPIKMDVTERSQKKAVKTNMKIIQKNKLSIVWFRFGRKNKSELTDEDYENFYNEKHYGFDKPLKHIHISVDGTIRYNAILYIPEKTPFDYYSKEL